MAPVERGARRRHGRGLHTLSAYSRCAVDRTRQSCLGMEDESGIELVEWIRQQEPPLRDTTILILTGSATPLQFDAAQKVGALAKGQLTAFIDSNI